MIFWMGKNARNLGASLRGQVDAATSTRALMIIAFVAVLREGFETVLFLLSAETSSASGTSVVIGGLLGLVVAAILGRLVYAGGNKLNLALFFRVTGFLLLLFAAGLFGKFFHEYRELLGFEDGWLVSPAWEIKSGIWAEGTFYDFMKGFFGWHYAAENIRVITYFAYLLPVGWLFLQTSKKS
jgi:high-affinity iron transporter